MWLSYLHQELSLPCHTPASFPSVCWGLHTFVSPFSFSELISHSSSSFKNLLKCSTSLTFSLTDSWKYSSLSYFPQKIENYPVWVWFPQWVLWQNGCPLSEWIEFKNFQTSLRKLQLISDRCTFEYKTHHAPTFTVLNLQFVV